ncbi:MAG: DUF4004 family protein [Clostridia bacterium]|nr:DUF4004 family protein [Clostridia bacterium]MBR6577585.1 DUF4004 family protein [Clostridia bacterium]
MEQELISKKELLEKYAISYGALYRWKRKGLIPEDWFIKKSTVTGQETFFPRELVCERIELIKKQKDDVSLDELSDHFSSESKKKATLVIDTAFGKKVFYLNDIRSILLEDNEGNKKDITDEVIGGTK